MDKTEHMTKLNLTQKLYCYLFVCFLFCVFLIFSCCFFWVYVPARNDVRSNV